MAIETQNPKLAALIIADHSLASPLILGRSLTELQIARVVATGARHIVCLVQQLSVPMLAVADNLRANGLTVDIVRSIGEAADAVHPDENVFLVASQVLVSGKILETMLAVKPPSLLCLDNDAKYGQFELIDLAARWTGYAVLNGASLRDVAAMIGDWDAASTILRHLVQAGAKRVVLPQAQADNAMLTARDSAEAFQAGRKLLSSLENISPSGFGERWFATPSSRLAARIAGELGLKSRLIRYSAVGFAVAAAVISLTGWLGSSLLLILIAYLAQSTGTRLAAALADLNPRDHVVRSLIAGSAAIAIGAFAITLASRTGQWGCLILGGLLLGSQFLIANRTAPRKSLAPWLADPLSGIVLLMFGTVFGSPIVGLFLSAGHSVASYLILDRLQHPPIDHE